MFVKYAYDQPKGHASIDWALVKKFFPFLKPHAKIIIGSLLLMPFMIFSELAQPYILKTAIDDYIFKHNLKGLLIISLLFCVFMCLEMVLKYYHFYFLQLSGQRVVRDVRDELFKHTESLNMSFYSRTPVGVLITRITNDLEVINEMFSAGLVLLISDSIKLVIIVTLMATMNVKLTLMTLLVVPLLVAGAIYFSACLRDAFREVRTRVARLNSHLEETLNGIETVHLFNAEDIRKKTYTEQNNLHRLANYKSIRSDSMLFALVESISFISIAFLIGYGGRQLMAGAVTFGMLVAFLEYIRKFFIPIRDLSAKFAIMQAAMVALEKIFSLFDVKDKPRVYSEHITIPEKYEGPHIEFRDVSFGYKDDTLVLKDVNLSIPHGSHVAVVGATGAGKTTLARLLLKLFEGFLGDIFYKGVAIRDISPDELRKRILLVSQDVYIFSGELRHNLTLGKIELSDAEILDVFKELGVEYFLSRFRNGLSTTLMEMGSNLSSGERQLLSFIRAYILKPDILVLDEATAHIDIETERLLQQAMRVALKNKTAILIAHRLQTILYADIILLMHRGRIKERGTHEELLEKNGIYRNLYDSQFINSVEVAHR